MKKLFILAFLLGTALILSSCVTAPTTPPAYPPVPRPPALRADAIHLVAPGETLWRIGKMYDVRIDDIMRANALRDEEKLEKGQRLLIPGAAPLVPVVTLCPSRKWKYIIIHHSATGAGNSLDFDRSHQSRGWKGIGYHFVIDNGTKGKEDGQLETSPRWLKQQNGSHCRASGMNGKAIGICLVGNFSKERVSQKQMDSLIYLVNRLRIYYKIPLKRIIGHGNVPGARTECPGKNFPWREFWSRLK
ncbi:N-acetylmuramoyl-L-alanine amidase [Candidatus Omnitrophota bacterium]